MCIVSFVGDHFQGELKKDYTVLTTTNWNTISRDEFEKLNKEVQKIKSLLIKAKIYDQETGQPDCSIDEKVEFLKKVAEFVGIDLDEVFDK